MTEDSENWADWWVGDWCPILAGVPDVEGMTEVDFAGQAASLIHRLRADFFDCHIQTTAANVDEANRTPDLEMYDDVDPDRVVQARVIHREAMSIEKHALWALDTWRATRAGEAETLRIAGVANECRDGRQSTSVATFERLLMTSVNSAFEFVLNFAEVSGSPAPFKPAKWPIHDVLAVLAIHAAANALDDMLRDCRDQPLERRLRGLLNAKALDGMAREYKAKADAKAEPSRRGSKAKGVPRPKAHSPLRVSLQVLVDRGLSNAAILRFLSDDEGIADDSELPIETNEPETSVLEDGYLVWYPRGGTAGEPTRTTVKTIINLLSKVRNPV
jgi:hypothetical protein